MVKRLRGWKKDVETGLAERPDIVEEDPSPLATKLLSHWAHGSLSAKAIQELAHYPNWVAPAMKKFQHWQKLAIMAPTLAMFTKP